jgi:DNA polymerase-3 subunit delta'
MLVSHRPARLAATIRSRCVQIAVPIPEESAAIQWLEQQGARNATDWLAYAGGAPARALALSSAEQSEQIMRWRRALEAGDPGVLEGVRERDEVEILVDVVQRHALDQAMEGFGLMSKYRRATPASVDEGKARQWLAYARSLCRYRALARHPLNPRLFAADVLATLPVRRP